MAAETMQKTILAMIDSNERTIDELLTSHGDSIRPAWVGEEIGIYYYRIKHLKKQLIELGGSP
tara:strand:- start:3383 stop:3571 length:189 start_codon:yes stop_codon:yes gene_type:complete